MLGRENCEGFSHDEADEEEILVHSPLVDAAPFAAEGFPEGCCPA